MMSYLLLAVIAGAGAFVFWLWRSARQAGRDHERADALREHRRKTKDVKDAENDVAGMSDDAVADRLRDFARDKDD